MNKKIALIDLTFSVPAELEIPFVDLLKQMKLDQPSERAFMDKHNLSVLKFLELYQTLGQLIFKIENAQTATNSTANN